MDWNQFGAFHLAKLIKERKLSSQELVAEQIKQIKNWNPKLNAMVEDRFDLALKEAQSRDELLGAHPDLYKTKKLWGVPITIKEMIAVEGMKTTLGSFYRQDNRTKEDATVVNRLREHGAIIVGTTNVPEVGLWFETDNNLYGRTNNPHILSRTPGGSSGGEAALIGAGASLFGIGSDVGGSIRMPAAFCGIFGHKPSERIIPATGHFPIYQANAADFQGSSYPMTTVGPMARTADDLSECLELIIGADKFDQEAKRSLKKLNQFDLRNLNVFILPNPQYHSASECDMDLQNCVLLAAQELEKRGAKVKELPRNYFLNAVELWFDRMGSVEGRSFESVLTNGQKFELARELLNLALRKPKHTIPAMLMVILEKTAGQKGNHPKTKLDEINLKRQAFNELLGPNSVLLTPAFPRVAPKHGTSFTRPFDFIYTAVFNALGNPATVAPIKLNKEGLPVGIQVVGQDLNDYLCISVAKELEAIFGGWLRPG